MTVKTSASALASIVTDESTTTSIRSRAAKALVEIRDETHKSYRQLGVPKDIVTIVESLAQPAGVIYDGKLPHGVHRMKVMPKGENVKGKVWQNVEVVLPNGDTIEGSYETTRGTFVYFYVGEQGYRADRFRFKFDGNTLALNEPVQ